MKVTRLILREMGEYNDMPIRSFVTDYTPRRADELAEVTRGGQDINAGLLAGIAGRVIRPASRVEGTAAIVSGWGERRFLFIMTVELRKSDNSYMEEVLTGFTDHIGASVMDSRSVKLDREMTFHFNSRFKVRRIKAHGRDGAVWTGNISDNSQILARQSRASFSTRGGDARNGTMTMRPEDFFVRKSVSKGFLDAAGAEGFRDMRAGYGNQALKFSRRENTQSSQWLSRTLTAARDAVNNDFLDEDEPAVIAARGRAKVKEQLVSTDQVFREMAADTQIMESGFVTYGELLDMRDNRHLDEIVDVVMADRRTPMHRRGDTENWGGSDNETVASTIIANAMPTILMNCMYSEAEFFATNDTISGEHFVKVSHIVPYLPETDLDEMFNQFVSMIQYDLLPDLFPEEHVLYEVRVKLSIMGECRIEISVEKGPFAQFTYPVFCDSVMSPIITETSEILDTLTKDIGNISDRLRTSPNQSRNTKKGSDFL